MTQTVPPEPTRDLAEVTDRDIAIMAQKAASGEITAEEYFEAVRVRARAAVDQEVARYESTHPWWRFILGSGEEDK